MKGVDALIATVLILIISITAIFLALQLGGPSTQRTKEILLMQEGKNTLSSIDNSVKAVLTEGEGSTRVLRFSVSGGYYKIDNSTSSITFSMESFAQIIAEGTSKIEDGINFTGEAGMVYLNLSYDNIQVTGEAEFGRGYHTLTIRNNGYNTTTQKQMIYISLVPLPPPTVITFTNQYNQTQTLNITGKNTTSPNNLNDFGINTYNITESLESGGQSNYFQGSTTNITGFNTTPADYTNSLDSQNYNVTSNVTFTSQILQFNQSQTLNISGSNTTSPDNLNKIDGLSYNITENALVKTQSNTSSDLQSGTIQGKVTATQNWYNALLNGTNNDIADSWVNESSKTTNYGTATTLIVRQKSSTIYNARIFLLWNLSAIPSGSTITNANLSLYCSAASSSGRTLQAWNTSLNESNSSTTPWTETNVAWNSQPPINTSGAVLQQAISAGTTTGWKYWNVTNAAISSYSQTNKNMSIGIKDSAENSSATSRQYTFTSKEGTASQIPTLNVTYYNWTSYINANTTTTYYNNTYSSPVLSVIANISVTVNVSSYNSTGSAGKNSNPDLWLEVWDGSVWSAVGNMSITTTGNKTVYVPIQDNIYTWWQNNPTQRNISIKGRYFDANATAWDEINYTDVWVKIDSKDTTYRSEVEHNATVSYSGTLNSINVSINFSTNVTSNFSLTIYNFNSGSWNYTACQNGTATAGNWYNWWCNITSNPSFYNSSTGIIRVRLNETAHSGLALIREDYVQYYVGYTTTLYSNISVEHNSSTILEDTSSISMINVTTVLKTNISSGITFSFYIYNFSSNSWEQCSQASVNTTYRQMDCIAANPSNYISNSKIRIRLNSSSNIIHQMMEDYLVYQITIPSEYKMEVEHNATGVSWSGTLNNISISLNFSTNSTSSPTFNLTIYNFNSGIWNYTVCQGGSVNANTWYYWWCNITDNPSYYNSSNEVIRIRLNETSHVNLAEVKEDYVQYYITYTQ